MPKNTGDGAEAVQEGAGAGTEQRASCAWLLRAKYLVDAEGLNKVQGKPFLVSEIEEEIEKMLK